MSKLFIKAVLPTTAATTTLLVRPTVTATQRITVCAAASRTRPQPFIPRTTTPRVPARGFRSTPAAMSVHKIDSPAAFSKAIADNKVVVVDFYADWCGPCRTISPKIDTWSKEYPNIHFVKVNVDEQPEISQEYEVRAMPTFLLFKDGTKVDSVVGAVPPKLEAMIKANHPASA